MAEYIEREKVKDALLHEQYGYLCEDAIDSVPAADVRPVVRGHWIEEEKDGQWKEYCSNCREHIPKGKWGQPWHSSYCPHCGAEMEG